MLDLASLDPTSVPATTPAGERLLAVADELFYARGIGAVGVDLLADAAGVTKRTLYQRFGSKDALVAVYLRRRAHRWQTLLVTALSEIPHATTDELVRRVFAVAEEWAQANPRGCAFVNAWGELGLTSHPAAAVIRDEKEWMLRLFVLLTGSPSTAAAVHLVYEGAHVVTTTLADGRAYADAANTAALLVTESPPGCRSPAAG